jgi:transcription antitermination factor NusG
LERQEFVYYNPRIKLRSSGRIAQLFPNYMFVAAIAERWRALLATKGIVRLLMSGVEQPATISQEVIDQLRAREVGGLVKLDQRRFRENQTVQVQRGVFAQQLAIYNGQCGSDRAFVLLRWLGAQRRVKIDEDNLAAV